MPAFETRQVQKYSPKIAGFLQEVGEIAALNIVDLLINWWQWLIT
jgi:hypothetical protein